MYVSKCLYLRHLDTYTSLRSLPLETSAQRKHCKQAPSQAKHLAFVRHAEGMRGRGIRGGILGVFGGIRVIFGVFGRTCPILDLAVVANLIMNSRPTFPFIKLKGKKMSEKGDPEAHAGASSATVLKFYEPSPLLFWSFGSEKNVYRSWTCLTQTGPGSGKHSAGHLGSLDSTSPALVLPFPLARAPWAPDRARYGPFFTVRRSSWGLKFYTNAPHHSLQLLTHLSPVRSLGTHPLEGGEV